MRERERERLKIERKKEKDASKRMKNDKMKQIAVAGDAQQQKGWK